MPPELPALDFGSDRSWRLEPPRAQAGGLLVEESGRLRLLQPDLSPAHDFGAVGPVDCPIAYDPQRRLAFRYVCAQGFSRGDYSQLRAFSVDRRESFVLKELALNHWVLWLLEWVQGGTAGAGRLFGLVALDRPRDDRVVIDHRLFIFRPGSDQLNLRALARDAYKPLAFSRQRRELAFAGAAGIYLLGLRGERKASLPPGIGGSGHGAAFDPGGAARIVLGGDGLHLWDVQRGTCHRLTRNGRLPVWAPDGRGIYYRESSDGLHYYDFEEDASWPILSLGRRKHPEFWYARPVQLSPNGQHLLIALTEKTLRGVSRKMSADTKPEKIFRHEHWLVRLDLRERRYWLRPGFVNRARWVG